MLLRPILRRLTTILSWSAQTVSLPRVTNKAGNKPWTMQATPAATIFVPKPSALMKCCKYVSSTDAGCSMNMLRRKDMRTPHLEFASPEDKSILVENAPKYFFQCLKV
jgi:hypothetical protein